MAGTQVGGGGRTGGDLMGDPMQGCVFCGFGPDRPVAANEHAVAIRDGYPVTEGHTLVIPRRHVASVFELTAVELSAIAAPVAAERAAALRRDPAVSGFYVGDMDDPRGGVRHVLSGRGNYLRIQEPAQ